MVIDGCESPASTARSSGVAPTVNMWHRARRGDVVFAVVVAGCDLHLDLHSVSFSPTREGSPMPRGSATSGRWCAMVRGRASTVHRSRQLFSSDGAYACPQLVVAPSRRVVHFDAVEQTTINSGAHARSREGGRAVAVIGGLSRITPYRGSALATAELLPRRLHS